ncbi:MAG TPA: hypothetical protein VGY99_26640, partial [Candidatus Binataceae bacterium]|nr:hypothetical protein [Candidatus Binataceae bacterium]
WDRFSSLSFQISTEITEKERPAGKPVPRSHFGEHKMSNAAPVLFHPQLAAVPFRPSSLYSSAV